MNNLFIMNDDEVKEIKALLKQNVKYEKKHKEYNTNRKLQQKDTTDVFTQVCILYNNAIKQNSTVMAQPVSPNQSSNQQPTIDILHSQIKLLQTQLEFLTDQIRVKDKQLEITRAQPQTHVTPVTPPAGPPEVTTTDDSSSTKIKDSMTYKLIEEENIKLKNQVEKQQKILQRTTDEKVEWQNKYNNQLDICADKSVKIDNLEIQLKQLGVEPSKKSLSAFDDLPDYDSDDYSDE